MHLYKMKFLLYPILISLLLFGSCKKKNYDLSEGESPAQEMVKYVAYLNNVEDAFSFEIGYTFSSKKPGRITQLGCRLFEQGPVKVSLWDFDTKVKIDSVTINVKDTKKFTFALIEPVTIIADKKYVVSVNTFPARDYYVFSALGDYNILPLTFFENITIWEKRSNENGDFSFPERPTKKNFNGWADIVFVAD